MIPLKSNEARTVLGYLYLHDNERLYANEMAAKFGLDKRNLVKKLKTLEKEEVLQSEKQGNAVYYSINKKHPFYEEYKKIVLRTAGVEAQLKKALQSLEGIKEAYIFGSYAKNHMDAHSDIDLLVIGEAGTVSLQGAIAPLQKHIKRVINVINMAEGEFKQRKDKKDPLVKEILANKRIRLI